MMRQHKTLYLPLSGEQLHGCHHREPHYELVHVHQLEVRRQVPIPVTWDNTKMDVGFRSDLIIEGKVIVELKAIDKLAPVHYRQVLTHLRLTNMKLGLLINFDEELIKNGLKRVVNGL